MTQKEISRRTGIPASTIRYWRDTYGDYLPARRGESGERLYELERVLEIRELIRAQRGRVYPEAIRAELGRRYPIEGDAATGAAAPLPSATAEDATPALVAELVGLLRRQIEVQVRLLEETRQIRAELEAQRSLPHPERRALSATGQAGPLPPHWRGPLARWLRRRLGG